MKKQIIKKQVATNLHEIVLDYFGEEQDNILIKYFKKNKLKITKINVGTFKVHDGCTPNILFYPRKMKVHFQENGKNYIINCREESTVFALIKGHMPYKKEGE